MNFKPFTINTICIFLLLYVQDYEYSTYLLFDKVLVTMTLVHLKLAHRKNKNTHKKNTPKCCHGTKIKIVKKNIQCLQYKSNDFVHLIEILSTKSYNDVDFAFATSFVVAIVSDLMFVNVESSLYYKLLLLPNRLSFIYNSSNSKC